MGDLSTPEIIGITFIASVAISKAFDVVRRSRVRNGHAEPEPSKVTPATAPEFALMQRQMLANDEESKERLERIEELLRDIHRECLDEQVKRHHR